MSGEEERKQLAGTSCGYEGLPLINTPALSSAGTACAQFSKSPLQCRRCSEWLHSPFIKGDGRHSAYQRNRKGDSPGDGGHSAN